MERPAGKTINRPEQYWFYRLSNRLYESIRLSLVFWGYLLRGLVTFRLVDSLNAAFQVNHQLVNQEGGKIRQHFRGAFQNAHGSRALSIILPLLWIYLTLFITVRFSGSVSSINARIIKYSALLLAGLVAIVVTSALAVGADTEHAPLFLWTGFDYMCRHKTRAVLLAGLLYFGVWVSLRFPIFPIFFGPGVFIWLAQPLMTFEPAPYRPE